MPLNRQQSRQTSIAVNVAKLALLAALTPSVIAGIAQRAAALGDGVDVAAIAATTVSLGSLSAVLGALVLGALADTGSASLRARWGWVALSTLVGTAGLIVLSTSDTRMTLTLGWIFAQLGYSGAMAVLRVILAAALPEQRRRGAVVVVLGSYGGIAIPLVILALLPTLIWETTFGLALLSLAVPLVILVTMFGTRGERQNTIVTDETESRHDSGDSTSSLSRTWLLVMQCAANIVVAVFLTFHPLELGERADDGNISVQATAWVIVAALVGLILATGTLIWMPSLLANSSRLITVAGVALGVSLILRAVADPFSLVLVAATLSGAAVGLNSSALFAAALEIARKRGGGKLMGAYSAAGATGQVIGPMVALGALYFLTHDAFFYEIESEYRVLFLLLAVLPFSWAVITFVMSKRRASERPALTLNVR